MLTSENTLQEFESAGDSAQVYLARYHGSAFTYYLPLVILVILVFLSLPCIKLERHILSAGMIRPAREKMEIRALRSGIITELAVKDNAYVMKNQLLIRLDNSIRERMKALTSELKETRQSVDDLSQLLQPDRSLSEVVPNTPLYREMRNRFLVRLNRMNREIFQTKAALNRARHLFESDLISRTDFENYEADLENSESEKNALFRDFRIDCRTRYQAAVIRCAELSAELHELQSGLQAMEIRSPVSGTCHTPLELSPGMPVYAGQLLASISPDTELVAVLTIPPREVGFLHRGDTAVIEIDGYRKNEWGVLKGNIIDISEDWVSQAGGPAFLVKCKLERSRLESSGSRLIRIKKGMTIRATFRKQRFSLLRLISDQLADRLIST